MPRLHSFVLASIGIATALVQATSAFAGRQVHGGDVARLLAGKLFVIQCFDGTRGRGQFSQHGVVTANYRRPSTAAEENDRAVVRVRGVEICLAWKQFGGGGDGCYPVSEEAGGTFRLGSGPLWCDITAGQH